MSIGGQASLAPPGSRLCENHCIKASIMINEKKIVGKYPIQCIVYTLGFQIFYV